jgi:predicted GIY-YIG superfamily endonuclease
MEKILLQKSGIEYNLKYSKDLLQKSGVYIFSNKSDVQYVGCSKNIFDRLSQHLYPSGISKLFQWNQVEIIFCDNYFEVEKFCIKELKPSYNGGITSNVLLKQGTGYTMGKRHTLILQQDIIDKVKAIAYWERRKIQDIANEAILAYIDQYELLNGKVKTSIDK